MDETYIKVKGVWQYLYRAIDKHGKTVGYLLTAKRNMAAGHCQVVNPTGQVSECRAKWPRLG
jgi:transposase-like protein